MSIFNAIALIGGLALFLYGMNLLGEGLSKTSGGKLESILEKLTSNPIKGVLLGAGVTAVIQSSSATTVMVVGFVNSGIMKLHQAVGIIMGANIGTTATSWLLSLTGIQGDSFFIKMLKPMSFSPILAIIGVIMIMFCKKEKKHDIGKILVGFAILMYGMEAMSSAVKPLADVPEFITYTYHVFKSSAWYACGTCTYSNNPELIGFCRYSSGIVCNRKRYICNSTSYYYGSEYRYMCYSDDFSYRS